MWLPGVSQGVFPDGGGLCTQGVGRRAAGTSRKGDFGGGSKSSCTVTRHYHINLSLQLLAGKGHSWGPPQLTSLPSHLSDTVPQSACLDKPCLLIGNSRRSLSVRQSVGRSGTVSRGYSWQLLTWRLIRPSAR